MKKYFNLKTLIAVLFFLWGCEKEQTNPVLNLSSATPATLTTPAEGTSFDLETFEDNFVFSWNPANYNIDELPSISYRIVAYLSTQENNFREHMLVLSETTTTSDTIIINFLWSKQKGCLDLTRQPFCYIFEVI